MLLHHVWYWPYIQPIVNCQEGAGLLLGRQCMQCGYDGPRVVRSQNWRDLDGPRFLSLNSKWHAVLNLQVNF